MKGFAKRRLQWIAALAVATVAAAIGYVRWAEELQRFTYLTGWLLFALLLVLTAYNGRKKLPFLPLGSSEAWLEFHIYAGFFTAVLFLGHVRFRWPTGWFETVLFGLYVVVALSGIFGLVLTRSLPKRLTARGGEVLFERIPFVRRDLHERSETLALQSATAGKTPIIAEFYARHLSDFFARPRHFVYHLLEIRSPLNSLLNKLTDLKRFLNTDERAVAEQLSDFVRQKDGLDYQRALQLALRLWLFVHIPATYSLMLWAVAHIILVYGFSGGAR